MEEFKSAILETNNKQSLSRYKHISNILLVLSIVACALTTALLIYTLIDCISKGGWALFVFVLILAAGTIGVAISAGLALIGLVMTSRMLKHGVKKGRLVVFAIFTALPIIVECAVIITISLL